MKSAILLLLISSFSTFVFGQTVPQCAQSCILNAPLPSGCGAADYGCICKAEGYLHGVSCCAFAACQGADQQVFVTFAVALCSGAGVTVNTAAPVCNDVSPTTAAIVSPTSGAAPGNATPATTTSNTGSTPTPSQSSKPSSGNALAQNSITTVLFAAVLGLCAYPALFL